jgi:heme A synthase
MFTVSVRLRKNPSGTNNYPRDQKPYLTKTMNTFSKSSKHHKLYLLSTFWTLGLLFLGSIVHATGSSLACPDWPTCYGTMFPEMTGGIFWEHLHRLVAGGLILLFIVATWVSWNAEKTRPAVRQWSCIGIFLLLVQSIFGGLTVILKLPDAISTTHLALAFLFLSLVTVLTAVTSPTRATGVLLTEQQLNRLSVVKKLGILSAILIFSQSVLGAVVRHTGTGLVCPDVPLCFGEWIPPLGTMPVVIHFSHRLLGIIVLISLLVLAYKSTKTIEDSTIRTLAFTAVGLGISQVILGFLSVYSLLAIIPVSLHTLIAALLLSSTVYLSTLSWQEEIED